MLAWLAGIAGAAALYAFLRWDSLQSFVGSIDHTPELFADFVRIWRPAGERLLAGSPPPPGFYYSPAFAVLMVPFGALDEPTAVRAWAIVQAALFGLLLLVPGIALRRRSPRAFVLYAAFLVLAVATVQNLRWGQVSTFIVAAVCGAFLSYGSGRRTAAALLLAVPIAVKVYPALVLPWFVLRRDVRLVVTTLLAAALLALAPPILVAGFDVTHEWLLATWREAADVRPRLIDDANSQYIVHVASRAIGAIERISGTPPRPAAETSWAIVRWIGYALAAALVVAAHRRVRGRPPTCSLEAAGLLLCAAPFVVETSWPHYFVHLPLVQTLVAARLLARRSRAPIAWIILAAATLVSSTPLHQVVGAARHGYLGFPFCANAALAFALLWIGRHRV